MAKLITMAEATDRIILEKNSLDTDTYQVDATDWMGGRANGVLSNGGVALSTPAASTGTAPTVSGSPAVVTVSGINTARGTFAIAGGAVVSAGVPGVSTATLTFTFANGEVKTMPMTIITYA